MTDNVERSFLRTLLNDVLAARVSGDGTDGADRRNLVRSTFAAVEGGLWLCREHVLSIAEEMETLTPLASLALREQTYAVTDKGTVIEQMRSVALGTAIRLLENQARLIAPNICVRYDHAGWQSLQAGIRIRNRITHPKAAEDLTIADPELTTIDAGLRWFFITIEYVMAATTLAYRSRIEAERDMLDALIAGDPETVRAYNEALDATK